MQYLTLDYILECWQEYTVEDITRSADKITMLMVDYIKFIGFITVMWLYKRIFLFVRNGH